ncbi:phosphoribosylaminoimidazolesuccinocarboxamide synthase [Celerinatantimonas diazotrophica]|uniref:Phosphoribosylaminoimidazole-succinocarboxamide synthase n=1 Tax=Celerinatantimonas diazotrophica TaxID=412034 RepID=A0A4R1J7Q5_9GAMM|nr:phosphoribosylaminoimidazolesuccinocarboxamide synthase [Celerinatantimonas diazotrophica]TCK46528.1 phosphoribosylaminoimidazole-succinocarboxamide synthase [Celerinatantimonas diazotrophica]CAG9296578.1 Phosphoribosylaminoimidazole-succinocarboxamide synthase [Celerinatantimonas diazotrophica]
MNVADQVMAVNNDLPIRTALPVHSGKVRSVYWLTEADSRRLIEQKNYPIAADTPLAVMVISDRISAFDCIWHGEGGMQGVPGKGASLNAISNYWFEQFKCQGLAQSHIVDIPHPLVWIVQKARPVMVEAIARQYITGSMWRAYQQGEREFCGITLPEGLKQNQKLPELLVTPSTKGILEGIPGVQAADDVNVSRADLINNYQAFGFCQSEDVDWYEKLLKEGFETISQALAKHDQIFVDTKFEFGYVKDMQGNEKLIYMDEVGTPDSSRIWDGPAYRNGEIIENSKEGFRQMLLNHFPDPDILLNKNRMSERFALARDNALPVSAMMALSDTYRAIAQTITGQAVELSDNPRQEIIDCLNDHYQLIV